MNLFINWFDHHDNQRAKELEFCRDMNESNEHIKNIVIVNEGKRATYNQLFQATYDYPHDINIIANLDIFFDDTLKDANKIGDKMCFALSRWEYNGGALKLHGGGNPLRLAWSQDVWIFRGQAPMVGRYRNYEFGMGVPGCDNVLAYQLKENGYQLRNPCYSIKAIHVHATESRDYPARMGNPSVYHRVWPSTINGQQIKDTHRRSFRNVTK